MRVKRVDMDVFSFRSLLTPSIIFSKKKRRKFPEWMRHKWNTSTKTYSMNQNQHVYDCMEHSVNFSFSNHIFCFRFHFRVLLFFSFRFFSHIFRWRKVKSVHDLWYIWYGITDNYLVWKTPPHWWSRSISWKLPKEQLSLLSYECNLLHANDLNLHTRSLSPWLKQSRSARSLSLKLFTLARLNDCALFLLFSILMPTVFVCLAVYG